MVESGVLYLIHPWNVNLWVIAPPTNSWHFTTLCTSLRKDFSIQTTRQTFNWGQDKSQFFTIPEFYMDARLLKQLQGNLWWDGYRACILVGMLFFQNSESCRVDLVWSLRIYLIILTNVFKQVFIQPRFELYCTSILYIYIVYTYPIYLFNYTFLNILKIKIYT
jgi:hypothetical protein